MNLSDSDVADSVAKIVRLRVFSGVLKLLVQFNKDHVRIGCFYETSPSCKTPVLAGYIPARSKGDV